MDYSEERVSDLDIEGKNMRQKITNKGISLIVLVITIIIIIILAGSVILSLNNGNIIAKSKIAKESSDFTSIREAVETEKTNSMFEGGTSTYTGMVPSGYINDIQVTAGGTILLKYNGATKITDIPNAVEKLGAIYIPNGFIYLEGEKDTGLVIKDVSAGITDNEYVWVPVEGTLSRTAFLGENIITGYIEDVGTAYDTMKTQVEKYNGFYVSRYEAGIAGTAPATTSSPVQDGTVKPLSQKNKIVWNKIPWDSSGSYPGVDTNNGAAKVAKSAYSGSSPVASSLLYGAQYDSMLTFINNTTTSVTKSTNWGNHKESTFTISTGAKKSADNGSTYTDASGATKPANTSWLLTTGTSEQSKAKNIYDVAGNAWEWTYELYPSSNYRVLRSGAFLSSGANFPAAYRFINNNDIAFSNGSWGFRFALYIK